MSNSQCTNHYVVFARAQAATELTILHKTGQFTFLLIPFSLKIDVHYSSPLKPIRCLLMRVYYFYFITHVCEKILYNTYRWPFQSLSPITQGTSMKSESTVQHKFCRSNIQSIIQSCKLESKIHTNSPATQFSERVPQCNWRHVSTCNSELHNALRLARAERPLAP